MSSAHCDDVLSLRARSEISHVDGRVYLSNWFAAKDRAKLASHKIVSILNCTTDLPCPFEGEIEYLRLPFADNPSESLPIDAALTFIDACAGNVLVHW